MWDKEEGPDEALLYERPMSMIGYLRFSSDEDNYRGGDDDWFISVRERPRESLSGWVTSYCEHGVGQRKEMEGKLSEVQPLLLLLLTTTVH